MESPREKNIWTIVKRAKSFSNAFRGIKIFFGTQPNAWIHLVATVAVVALGYYFCITNTEWIMLIFVIGLVLITEAINTALEFDIDLTSPTFHPYARDTKDTAAGAVLIAVIVAIIIGCVIFVPKILGVI